MNLIKTVATVSLLLFIASCNKKKQTAQQQASTPQEYPVEILHPQNVTLKNDYPVRLTGEEDIEISPQIDGTIQKIYVDKGAVVKKGQPLFSIDSPSATEGVATAQAAVASAQANLASAQLDVERMRPLAEKRIISNVQLEAYENQYRASQAAVDQAQANLNQAQATLGWTTVVSPVDGVVGTIPYRHGSLVSSNNVLTTVAASGNVIAYFSLNEKELLELLDRYPGANQAEKIKNMPEVTLTLADGSPYPHTGRIQTISGVIDDYTGSASLRAEFPNPDGTLRSGMSGTLSIPRPLSGILLVPQKATVSQQDKTLIYKVQGDSVVQTIITTLPTPDGKEYVVTEGLKNGDTIVTDGVATLSNGKKIKTR
ncbi:MAG: efflux RND transporter periplasmic adaptor subunit [Rikenellaceae bacterium]|nr:efflux RND transporter periplasmic adaptor subunit [Rikenellaceae bacterium]